MPCLPSAVTKEIVTSRIETRKDCTGKHTWVFIYHFLSLRLIHSLVRLLFICVYIMESVWPYVCGCMHLCSAKEIRRGNQVFFFFFQPSLTPLSQGLSLNPGLSFSQLSWKPAGPRNTLDSSTLRARITATYMMICLLCGFWDLNSVLVITYQKLFSYLRSHLSSLSFTILCFD